MSKSRTSRRLLLCPAIKSEEDFDRFSVGFSRVFVLIIFSFQHFVLHQLQYFPNIYFDYNADILTIKWKFSIEIASLKTPIKARHLQFVVTEENDKSFLSKN